MTLKELANSDVAKLMPSDTKIHIEKHHGCHSYTLDFDNQVHLGDVTTKLNEETLNKEIAFITLKVDTLVISFIEDFE